MKNRFQRITSHCGSLLLIAVAIGDAGAAETSMPTMSKAEAKELVASKPGVAAMKQPISGKTAGHCKYFLQAARKAASQDRALAAAHQEMASRVKN